MKVIFTDHALDRSDGYGRKRAEIPKSVLESIIKSKKGEFFYDLEEDKPVQVYNKNVIILEKTGNEDLKVITVYRDENPRARCDNSSRYRRIDAP